jgi:hypothetical protein
MRVAFLLFDPAAVCVKFVVDKVALRHDCRRMLRFIPVSAMPARTSGRRLGISKQRDVLVSNSTGQKSTFTVFLKGSSISVAKSYIHD